MDNSDIFSKIMEKKKIQSVLNDDQVIIFDTSYHFSQTLLFDEIISVSLPSEFVPMGEEWAAQKYPFISQPEVIYTNIEGDINITFDLLENTQGEFSKNDRLSVLLGMQESIKKMNPANTFFNMNNEENASWFDFRSYALDGKLYNIIFAVLVNGKLIFGNFSCPFDLRAEYELFAKRIILSVQSTDNEVTVDEN